MGFLLLENFFRDEQRKRAVLDANALYSSIEERLNLFPNEIRGRFEDIAAGDIIVIQKVAFRQYLVSV